MTDDSFTYNGIDMFKAFAIRMIKYDLILPPVKVEELEIPQRSGAFSSDKGGYGDDFHSKRELRMAIVVEDELSTAQMDDLKYELSRKGRIVVWDMPDRFFYGKIENPEEVVDYFAHSMREFGAVFRCDPYAYSNEPLVLKSTDTNMKVDYNGTRKTKIRIQIKNTGNMPLQGLTILSRQKKQ